MNICFRSLWNEALGAWVAVAEISRSHVASRSVAKARSGVESGDPVRRLFRLSALMSVVVMLGAAPFVPAFAQSVLVGNAGEGGVGEGIGGNGGAGGIGGGGGGGSGGALAGGGGGGYGAGGGGAGFTYGSNSGGAGGPARGGDGGSDNAGLGGAGNLGGGAGTDGVQGAQGPFGPKPGGSALSGIAEGSISGGLTSATFATDRSVNGLLGIGGSGGGGAGASGSAAGGSGSSGGAGALSISAGTTTVTGAVVVGGSGGGGGGGSGNANGGDGGAGGSGRLTVAGGNLVADSIVVGGSAGGNGSGAATRGLGGAAGNGTLTFTAGSMSVANGVTVNGNGLVDFKPGAGTQLTAGYAITGAGGVSQSGAGTTVMTGTNTYTGGTAISAGTLQIGAGGTAGSIVGNVGNDGTLAFNRSDSVTFGGVIAGSGQVHQIGSGTLELTAVNSYQGGTLIDGGTLRVASDSALGAATGALSFNRGGTLQTTAAFTSGRDVTLLGNGNIVSKGAVSMSGVFTGSGALDVQAATGDITLTNAGNDFGGAVSLGGATVQINDKNALTLGTLATGALTVTSHGDLLFQGRGSASSIDARSNGGAVTQTSALSVTGAMSVDAGAGSIALNNAGNDFRGDVSLAGQSISMTSGGDLSVVSLTNGVNGAVGLVAGGVLTLGTAIDTGTAALTLASSGGALNVDHALSGGTVSITGSKGVMLQADVRTKGTLTLASDASVLQTAGTVTAGTLTGNAGGDVSMNLSNQIAALGDFTAAGAFSLRNMQALQVVGNVAASSVALDVAPGVLVTGSISATGSKGESIAIASGTRLQVGNGGTVGVLIGNVTNDGALAFDRADTVAFAGAIAGKGALVQQGTGTLVLTGANSYTGGTSVKAGVLQGSATSLQGDIVNDATVVFEQTKAGGSGTYAGSMSGTGSLRKIGDGELVLASANTYSGGTSVEAGTLNASVTGALGQGPVSVANGAALLFSGKADMGAVTLSNRADGLIDFIGSVTAGQATIVNGKGGTVRISEIAAAGTSIGSLGGAGQVLLGAKTLTTGGLNADTEISGVISGTGGSLVKVGTGTLTLSGANTHTGGTVLRQGRLNVGSNQALGTGTLSMDDDTTLGFSADGLTIANAIRLTGQLDPIIDTGAFSGTLSGAISGGGFITKEGSGTLTLSGANTYTGATNVAQGTLKAGAANTLSAASAHSVATGATLDLAGFSQTVASLANSGTVSLAGATAGTTLTVRGNYVGNNGVLRLGTALTGTGPSDRLVIDGGTASGKTSVQIANLGGLGALTTGNGIEVVSAINGATTTAQTTKDAFSLAGGHVDAGAYEYRLYAADANGAGENWYLRSSTNAVAPGTPATSGAPAPVITYRPEASLYAALPGQLRQGNLAMLGDLRKRVGDDDVKGNPSTSTNPVGSDRRAWARVLSTDIDIQQGGTVSPSSKGRLTGFQAGTDLLATPNWRAGIYVGQLDGDASVRGFASGIQNLGVGRNDLRSQYVGVYGTYTTDSGFYADAVVQSGRHRYTVEPLASLGVGGKGNSLLGSIEVGQSFALGGSGWRIEPQLQLIHQHMDLGNSAIAGAIVQPQADSGWIARAGVRVKGEVATGLGTLQPYGRFNVYRTSSGADIARFVNGATTTDIVAPTGGTSTELAGGFTLALGSSTSLYGEIGKLWASGGNARVKGSINGSVGVRVKW